MQADLSLFWEDRTVEIVAGVDVHYGAGQAQAAIVLFSYPELKPVASVAAEVECDYPYIPGLLSFREGPAVLAAWDRLEPEPDLIFFDGQGIAHPRGIGLASHLGLWLERPTIGVAKSKLYGEHDESNSEKGAAVPLRDASDPGRVIGAVVRTQADVRPVYVSPGNLIDVPTSVEFTLACCTRSRLPEPTRWAHRVAAAARFSPAGRQG